VEDESIMEKVRELGIDFAQGYGLGRPQPIEDIFLHEAEPLGSLSVESVSKTPLGAEASIAHEDCAVPL
jgi:predicted signal transduction protein with EAL and GGDEF domain